MRTTWIVSKKECPKCHVLIGATGYKHHLNTCQGIGKLGDFRSTSPKLPNGKTEAWYESMQKKENGNQYTVAAKLGLPKPLLSEETREKLSKAGKGRSHSEEVKKKLSESAKKNHLGDILASRG